LGDCLIVCVNDDASVARLKGKGRPINSTRDRIAMLRELKCVDEVESFSEDDPTALLADLQPHVFVKGMDYAGSDIPERVALAGWGGRLEHAPLVEPHSTTRLLRLASDLAG
jgi:rfaE bifunctional protein nucleotidyltransferase chain/domain